MKYPNRVCMPCGKQHGQRPPGLTAWHQDRCDVCGKHEVVTTPNAFGQLKETWKLTKVFGDLSHDLG